LKVNYRDADGFDIDATSLANWTSSDAQIAGVGSGSASKAGTVTFASNGEARIFAFQNGMMDYMDFKVGDQDVAKHYGNLIILAGGKTNDANDSLQKAIQYLCNRIYQVFKVRMFKDEDIYYINNKNDQDFNGDGKADGIVDQTVKSVDTLHQAFQWAVSQANDGPLYLYLMDHGNKNGTFQIDNNQILTVSLLKTMIDEFEAATGRTSVVILEACYSGSFVSTLAGPHRMIIASSSQDQYSFFNTDGTVSFGQFLSNRLMTGETWEGAFDKAVADMNKIGAPYAAMTPQKSVGNAVAMGKVYGDFTMGSLFPEIKSYTAGTSVSANTPQAFSVQLDITDAAGINVWAMVTPPNYQPPTVSTDYTTPALNLDKISLAIKAGAQSYTGTYSFTSNGSYTVTYYAKDANGMVVSSPPQTFDVQGATETAGTVSAQAGWNLLSATVTVPATVFGSLGGIQSVWKWQNNTWAVYLPGEGTQGAYAASKNFGQLTSVTPGEGFWVNSTGVASVDLNGTPEYGELSFVSGWNLVGLKSNSPTTVAALTAGQPGILSVWKWENGNWSVSLPGEGTPGAYATAKNFGQLTTINPGEGFWVNKQ